MGGCGPAQVFAKPVKSLLMNDAESASDLMLQYLSLIIQILFRAGDISILQCDGDIPSQAQEQDQNDQKKDRINSVNK